MNELFKNGLAKLGYSDLDTENPHQRRSRTDPCRNCNSTSTSSTARHNNPPPRPPPPRNTSQSNHSITTPIASSSQNGSGQTSNPTGRVLPLIINPNAGALRKQSLPQKTSVVLPTTTTTKPFTTFSAENPEKPKNPNDPRTPLSPTSSNGNYRPPLPPKNPSLIRPASVSGNPPSRPIQQQDKNPSIDSVIREFRGTLGTLSTQFQKVTGSSKKSGQVYSQPSVPVTPTPVSCVQRLPNSWEDCLECRDFRVVDAHASNFSRKVFSTVSSLAYDLCSPFPSKTDKARAIFVWLHHNIAYDTASYLGGNIETKLPEQTLRTGLAVCHGYADLFAALAGFCGLDAVVVTGHGKAVGCRQNTNGIVPPFLSNHAWNAVQLDSGKWHLIDACWGAGYLDENQNFQKHLAAKHFTSSPETFRIRHFPTNGKYQYCSNTMSWEHYIMMKDGPLLYSSFDEQGFSPVTIQPHLRNIKPEPTKFVLTTKCKHTSIHPRDQEVILLEVDGKVTPFQVDAFGTAWSCESWDIRQGSQVTVSVLNQFGDGNGKGVSVQEYLRSKDSVGMSWVNLCKWDVS